MRSWCGRLALAWAVTLACGCNTSKTTKNTGDTCNAGETVPCTTAANCAGVRTCRDDGSGFDACECTDGGSGGASGGSGGSGGAAGSGGTGGSAGSGGASGAGGAAGLGGGSGAAGVGGADAGTCPSTCGAGTICVDGACDVDPTGLAAHWKLDETTGDVAFDSSPTGADCSLVNGPTWTGGKIGGALSFSPPDQYCTAGNLLDGIDVPLTVTAWVNLSEAKNHGIIVSDDSATGWHGFYFKLTPTGLLELTLGDGTDFSDAARRTARTADGAVATQTWQHLAAVATNFNNIKLYVGGIEPSAVTYTGSSPGPMAHDSSETVIGTLHHFSEQDTQGLIDDVRVYARALSADEIAALAAM